MSRWIDFMFKSMPVWPYPVTPDRRGRMTFKAGWGATQQKLRVELGYLGAEAVLIGVALREQDIRRDGLPRDDAREPVHPGVELSFTATALPRKPRIVYATDVCKAWQHNVRSIALGLEALRAVDRYGITRGSEQYVGFMALSAGGPDPVRGAALVKAAGGITEALRRHHPDAGGEQRDFIDVMAYKDAQGIAR